MLIAFLIYLINVFESMQKLACIFLIIGVCLIGVAFLFSVFSNCLDDEIDGKEVFRAIRKQNNDYKKITGKSALA